MIHVYIAWLIKTCHGKRLNGIVSKLRDLQEMDGPFNFCTRIYVQDINPGWIMSNPMPSFRVSSAFFTHSAPFLTRNPVTLFLTQAIADASVNSKQFHWWMHFQVMQRRTIPRHIEELRFSACQPRGREVTRSRDGYIQRAGSASSLRRSSLKHKGRRGPVS